METEIENSNDVINILKMIYTDVKTFGNKLVLCKDNIINIDKLLTITEDNKTLILVNNIKSIREDNKIVYTLNTDKQLEIFDKHTGKRIYKRDDIIAVSTALLPEYILLELQVYIGKNLHIGRHSKTSILQLESILINKETNEIETRAEKIVEIKARHEEYIINEYEGL